MKTMHEHPPLMTILTIATGSLTAITTQPNNDYGRVFLAGMVGGAGAWIVKTVFDYCKKKYDDSK